MKSEDICTVSAVTVISISVLILLFNVKGCLIDSSRDETNRQLQQQTLENENKKNCLDRFTPEQCRCAGL